MNESTEKTILVLANSMKKGGRCVAGIEITPTESGDWNLHDWIRPIDPTQDEGTIPTHRVNLSGSILKPLDCVKIQFSGYANDPYHPEDFKIDVKSNWKPYGAKGHEVFDRLPNESGDLWGAESAHNRKVEPKEGIKTLRLIKPTGQCCVEAYREDTHWGVKHRRYLYVTHDGLRHQFSIDDPIFSDRHNLSPESVGDKNLTFELDPAKTVIVASLTKPFNDFQWKIAATIFEI